MFDLMFSAKYGMDPLFFPWLGFVFLLMCLSVWLELLLLLPYLVPFLFSERDQRVRSGNFDCRRRVTLFGLSFFVHKGG